MALDRIPPEQLMVELLDRVLDKGVVIDAAVRVSVVGIRLLDMDMRVVVSSLQTHLGHAAGSAELRAAQRRVLEVGGSAVTGGVLRVELEPPRSAGVGQPAAGEERPRPPIGQG